MKNFIIITGIFLAAFACQPKEKAEQQEKTEIAKPDSPSFNPENSDAEAVTLADQVLKAHGGEENWDNTRYIAWNFLGARDLVWDKYTGNVRIDFPGQNATYLININEDTGRVKIGDRELTKNDSLNQYIKRGKQIWVNDSYWLVFPYKFKDPGVQLKYLGLDTTLTGKNAEVISLSFEKVGFTPQNKYNAYIDPETHLILQWDYYQNASDSAAAFKSEWTDYQEYGGIYLSSGRGERSLGDIKVAQEWDDKIFEEF
ncbi:hypothetical protein SAMN05661096_03092 [Marivirga sericea]|uniref:Lipoprotein n=1 Tax=Marivirga sericea TaxID=1028 RepID=A0A1X7KT79_9BACT|nr:hypothetical protein [Marivirga sericea]SMG44056.1 hypothetical protein SAMN05661096_03092 [Marivirga sericea]